MQEGMYQLSSLIWLPIVAGILLCSYKLSTKQALSLSLIVSLGCLVISFYLLMNFDKAGGLQFVEHRAWLPSLNIYYFLAIDGFSLPLVLLTTLITPMVLIHAYRSVTTRFNEYLGAFLILEGLMLGVFLSFDTLLFYLFWEAMLIPMFLIIGIYGGHNRFYASMKFFLYTFLGSIFLLVALLYLHQKTQSFDLTYLQTQNFEETTQTWLFWAFLASFAVKVPMFPVHTWLPDAHTEAPTGGSVILASILLKMGCFGFLRFILPLTPLACGKFAPLMCTISLIAIVYIGLIAIMQHDMKRLVAYSSISHMGFVTLGLFVGYMVPPEHMLKTATLGIEGAMVQMISHGFISSALFLCIGVLYERHHTRLIQHYGGIATIMPKFAAFFMFFALSNTGLPGTSGFVGELFIILAAVEVSLLQAFLAATTLVLSAVYTLWLYKRVLYGQIMHPSLSGLKDLSAKEFGLFAVLALATLGLGLKPAPLLELMETTTQRLIDRSFTSLPLKVPTRV